MGVTSSKSWQEARDYFNSSVGGQNVGETSKTQLFPESPAVRTSAYIADDPRSPAGCEATFDRTPLHLQVAAKAHNRTSTDSVFFLDHTPVMEQPKQSAIDPRSPTIGLERTPMNDGDSMRVMSNFSNLQMVWELDDSNISADADGMDASTKPSIVVDTPNASPAVEDDKQSIQKQRTPLSKVQVQSPLATVGNAISKKQKPIDIVIPRKQRLSTPTIQKQAQLNRIRRRDRTSIVEDKENP